MFGALGTEGGTGGGVEAGAFSLGTALGARGLDGHCVLTREEQVGQTGKILLEQGNTKNSLLRSTV